MAAFMPMEARARAGVYRSTGSHVSPLPCEHVSITVRASLLGRRRYVYRNLKALPVQKAQYLQRACSHCSVASL